MSKPDLILLKYHKTALQEVLSHEDQTWGRGENKIHIVLIQKAVSQIIFKKLFILQETKGKSLIFFHLLRLCVSEQVISQHDCGTLIPHPEEGHMHTLTLTLQWDVSQESRLKRQSV